LSVDSASIGDEGAGALAKAGGFEQLQRLRFTRCRIGDDGLAALLASRRLAGLTGVSLFRGEVTGAGVAALADTPGRSALRRLWLAWNPIVTVDIGRLAVVLEEYPVLELDLRGCPLPRPARAEILLRFGDRVSVEMPDSRRRGRRIAG
jgi:hypothetical protein